jgi:hypothetical protein
MGSWMSMQVLYRCGTVIPYKSENTKRSEVTFSAVLEHGASEFRLERTTPS